MKRVSLLLLTVLAGCAGAPDVPAHAVTDTDEALPGLTLHTWTQMHGERLRMHAVLENAGPQSHDIRYGCGQPWDSTIVAPEGDPVGYREVPEEPQCPVLWDVLRPKAHLDMLYSWDFRDHDVEADVHEPVPAGNYTWILQVSLRDRPEILETRIAILVD